MSVEPQRASFPLSAQIAVAVVLGLLLGPLLGPRAAPLGELGGLLIQLVKAVATPLLFLAICNAVVKTDLDARSGGRMLGIATVNAGLALTIGLILSNLFRAGKTLAVDGRPLIPPGSAAADYEGKSIDWLKTLAGHIPSNVVQPFAENLVLSVVLLALVFGFALRRVRNEPGFTPLMEILSTLLKITEVALGWVIRIIPFAVFGILAKTVGKYGFSPLAGLAAYVGVALLGLLLHIVFVYGAWIRLWAGRSWSHFWRFAKEPVLYAWGVNSSLATLPVTLRALRNMGVSQKSATLGACVGTNFNNDGILLYEGMAVLFVAQASGIDLSLAQQIQVALICMVAAMGVAGVPEAGFVSLALVLNTAGLPIELLPLLLTVDWIIARARSVTNVLSDMVLSLSLDGRRPNSPEDPSPAPAGA